MSAEIEVEAGARAIEVMVMAYVNRESETVPTNDNCARVVVAAVEPLIRERLAQEVEVGREGAAGCVGTGMALAARIVRGATS